LSLNFPQNPTGILIPRADLEELIVLCRSRGIYIFCDEVYRGVELDLNDQLPQIADVYEKGISLNVLSKAFGLPALRIGWIASQDKELLLKAEHFKHYLSVCNSGPSESLALIALSQSTKFCNATVNCFLKMSFI
jgi:aspartate/methionine/tyrosine aminotransferase